MVYYTITIGGLLVVGRFFPGALDYLPVGGDADVSLTGHFDEFVRSATAGRAEPSGPLLASLTLATYLIGAVLAVLPVTWVYMATHQDSSFKSNLVRALIVLPICAASTVLLIKDSLALAFGMAALVAAVRFRVRLTDPLDGIYILASIAVGLAAGIGYVGIGLVTTFFFSVITTLLWRLDYARNPGEDEKLARKAAKKNAEDPINRT